MAQSIGELYEDVIYIDQESTIFTLKSKIVSDLTDLIISESEKKEFQMMCARVESTIRAWYNRQFEEMMQLYQFFDPVGGRQKLERQPLAPAQVDKLESRFLQLMMQIMRKSQYKLLSDEELKVATSGTYMLDFPVELDPSKLDTRLLSKYFLEHHTEERPSYANQYLLFRRGLGLDQTRGLFVNEKIDFVIKGIWTYILHTLRLKRRDHKSFAEGAAAVVRKSGAPENEAKRVIERKRIENMRLSLRNLLGPVTVQEPTYERVILLYRKTTPPFFPTDLGDREIHIKQFQNIPMADLEICLPEKKNPSLTPLDWVKFIVSIVGGLYAIIVSLEANVSLAYIVAIAAAFLGYLSKVYFAWQASMARYRNLIMQSMYNKHIDSGRGTLLHLCADVIQQEVKEVIVAYFILITQGKATKEELDERCEEFMLEEFLEDIDFDVEDAVEKLLRLGIVSKNASGHFVHQSLKLANQIIGVTTEELVDQHR